MNNATLINQSSGDVEWYTPMFLIEASRAAMGRIGLDPASSEKANERVKADCFFGINDRAIERAWCDSVFLNHPFGRAEEACKPSCDKHLKNPSHKHHDYDYLGTPVWMRKMELEFTSGNVDQVCCLTFAATSEKWFQPLLKYPQCFLSPRTNYETPDGKIVKGVSKGSVMTYLGQHVDKFHAAFKQFGEIKVSL